MLVNSHLGSLRSNFIWGLELPLKDPLQTSGSVSCVSEDNLIWLELPESLFLGVFF